MRVNINDKIYTLKTQWDEVTLLEVDKLLKLVMPDSLKAIYEATDKKEYNRIYKELTSKELIKTHPAFFGYVLEILSDIPKELIDRTGYDDRTMFYHDFLEQIFVDVYYLKPNSYIYTEIKSFEHEGISYHLPEELIIFGNNIPMHKEKAMTFAEEADIMSSLEGINGAGGIAQLCAVMCREEGENYDEEKAIERAERFKNLPMTIVWEVFFYTIRQLNLSLNTMTTYFQKETVKETAKALV